MISYILVYEICTVLVGMQQTPGPLDKILQLYSSLQQNSNVIDCGPSSSGKTVPYRTLCLTLNRIHAKKNESNTTQQSDEIQSTKPMTTLYKNMPKVCLLLPING